ncbi:MAG: hypothetical protein EXR92_01300 [Gemmatimonadetes bacterium]|nr:hypothetical protein [Gemmatimonadota bacterium]
MSRTSHAWTRPPEHWATGRIHGALIVATLLLGLVPPKCVQAQFTFGDLVITAGASAEGYQGNLPAVSVPVIDSTEFVSAIVGEVAVRADATYRIADRGAFLLSFDGGLRQFSAHGFELRDYAPREWVGTLDASYQLPVSERARLGLRTRLRGREVEDRPPMPLFLQPGYVSGDGGISLEVDGPRAVVYDTELSASKGNFFAPRFAPQVRLLDRDGIRWEVGATLTDGEVTNLRLFAAVEGSRYPKQGTFAPEDPYRKDRTFYAGASWTHQGRYLVQVELDGRANRSNSNRPEYDAFTLRGLFSTSIPGNVALALYGAVTGKQYLHDSSFARLLPGEEANNASLAYVSFSRAIARNVAGTLRVGWTRAESEIGGAYFQRFGGSFLLQYRPL